VLKISSRVVAAVLLMAGTLFLAGCPERTDIGRINSDPSRYNGKEVAIAGHVTNSFGALGTGVFEIDDGTGRMWVFSERYGVPGRGERRIGVVGRIEQGVTVGGRHFALVLRETERRHY